MSTEEGPINSSGEEPETDPVATLLKRRLKQLRRTALYPLVTNRPICEVPVGGDVGVKLIGAGNEDGARTDLEASVVVLGGEPPELELQVFGELVGEPLGLLLGEFWFWEFEPVVGEVGGQEDGLETWEPSAQSLEHAAAFAAPLSLGDEDITILASESSPEHSQTRLEWGLYEDESGTLSLKVTAEIPHESEGEWAIVEISQSDNLVDPQRFLLVLKPSGPNEEERRLTGRLENVSLPSIDKSVTICVRPLTVEELEVLDSRSAAAFLSMQDYVFMPINASSKEDSWLRIPICHTDQRSAASDPKNSWVVQTSLAVGSQ